MPETETPDYILQLAMLEKDCLDCSGSGIRTTIGVSPGKAGYPCVACSGHGRKPVVPGLRTRHQRCPSKDGRCIESIVIPDASPYCQGRGWVPLRGAAALAVMLEWCRVRKWFVSFVPDDYDDKGALASVMARRSLLDRYPGKAEGWSPDSLASAILQVVKG